MKSHSLVKTRIASVLLVGAIAAVIGTGGAIAQDESIPGTEAKDNDGDVIRLSKDDEVWLDKKNKTVTVGGKICLREGLLEMFACPKGTKEHESIVSVNCRAFMVHAALLALGVKEGRAVRYEPDYAPAKGREINVEVSWKDKTGKQQRVRAQQWILDVKTGRALQHPWVFVGSGFWTDATTGKRYYHAEGGELICVSNFTTAMLDLPVPSSQSNDELLFQAHTERIPPKGTPVKLILTPKPLGAVKR